MKRFSMWMGLAAALNACGGSGGVDEPALSSAQQGLEVGPLYDFCANAPADVVRHVGNGYDTPLAALPYRAVSGSGGYGYSLDDGCGSFIVDAKLAQATPKLELSAGAYDLPSAAAAGGVKPANAEDCGRYSHSVRYYHRKGDAGGFTFLGSATVKGNWTAGSCQLYVSSGTMERLLASPTAGAGWDYYRTAVRVKLRSSYQEAAVGIGLYVAPPA